MERGESESLGWPLSSFGAGADKSTYDWGRNGRWKSKKMKEGSSFFLCGRANVKASAIQGKGKGKARQVRSN